MSEPLNRTLLLRAALGAALALGIVPGAALVVGQQLSGSVSALEGSEQLSRWRQARMALRVARLSPLMWSAAAARETALDQALSTSYLLGTIDGSITEPDEHTRFLESRASQPQWRSALLVAQLRYGDAESVLASAEVDADAPLAVAAALMQGDTDALAAWLPRAPGAPDALRLLAGQPVGAPASDAPMARFLHAESLRRQGATDEAVPLLDALRQGEAPVAGLAQAAWMLAQPTATSAPRGDSDPSWMAGWLLAAARAPTPEDAASAAEAALRCVDGALPSVVLTYQLLAPPFLPHPDHFDGAITAVGEPLRTSLRLAQARAALQGFEIARAQAALKAIGEPGDEALRAEVLMLRVAARELAADIPGALRYAEQGEALPSTADKMRFKLLRARLLLTGAQGNTERSEALTLLDRLRNYPLPPELEAERGALVGLTIQQTGEQEPFTLAGLDAPGDLYIDDATFRRWFVRYVDRVSSAPRPSAVLAALRYWRAANQRGGFLIAAQVGEAVSPRSALVRAHLQFARQRILDGDSSGWRRFTDARALVADEPFRDIVPLATIPLPAPPTM